MKPLIYLVVGIVLATICYADMVGPNSFTYSYYARENTARERYDYTPALRIGDFTFSSGPLQFNCKEEREDNSVSAPNPRKECWSVQVTYGEVQKTTVTMNAGDILIINTYLQVYFSPSGTVRWGTYCYKGLGDDKEVCRSLNGDFKYPDDWRNNFIFTFGGSEFLFAQDTDDVHAIKINEYTYSKFKITNNLFNNMRGQIFAKQINYILETTRSDYYPIVYPKGETVYDGSVLLRTDMLGDLTQELIPMIFINIPWGSQISIYNDNSLIKYYRVIPNIGDLANDSVSCASSGCPTGFHCEDIEGTMICMKDSIVGDGNFKIEEVVEKGDTHREIMVYVVVVLAISVVGLGIYLLMRRI